MNRPCVLLLLLLLYRVRADEDGNVANEETIERGGFVGFGGGGYGGGGGFVCLGFVCIGLVMAPNIHNCVFLCVFVHL